MLYFKLKELGYIEFCKLKTQLSSGIWHFHTLGCVLSTQITRTVRSHSVKCFAYTQFHLFNHFLFVFHALSLSLSFTFHLNRLNWKAPCYAFNAVSGDSPPSCEPCSTALLFQHCPHSAVEEQWNGLATQTSPPLSRIPVAPPPSPLATYAHGKCFCVQSF